MHVDSGFAEMAGVLLTAVGVGALGAWLRQPLIVSFIVVGILVGPAGIGLVGDQEEIELLASVGIALLLFVVGLKLDIEMVRTVGPVAVATGVGQVVFTSVIGFLIAVALGYAIIPAAYVAVALTFSSTIIIVKLLSDKREIDALHGRIAVGFLIIQDLAVILAMIALTAIGPAGDAAQLGGAALDVALAALGFLAAVGALTRWVLPAFTAALARVPELLVLFGIAWAVALAAVGEALGLSREVGAFLAGVSLASTEYRDALGTRLVTVRDFLLLFFFIDLGARLDLSLLGATLVPSLVFSVFVLVGNPIIVMAIMGVMGYRRRTGFLAGLTVAQISEFSLILGALGLGLGHIDQETMGLITTVGLVTIGLSTYLILYSGPLYERLAPLLGVFERAVPYREMRSDTGPPPVDVEIVLFGLGRYGGSIARHLRLRNRRVLGVDFDPEALARWRAEQLPVLYGDAEDPDLFEHLPLARASWVVSSIPDVTHSQALLRHLREHDYRGRVAISCRTPEDAERLRFERMDVLLRPFADAAEQAADAITSGLNRLGPVVEQAPGLEEVRLGSGSVWAGRRLQEVPLRDEFNVSVLAVSRSGRSTFNPGPEFQLFPGDRLIMTGEPANLAQAAAYLQRVDFPQDTADDQSFVVEEIAVADRQGWASRSLADLDLRRRLDVTVIALRHADGTLKAPDPHQPLAAGQRLILAGRPAALSALAATPLGEPPA
jgi:Kef-type K+ transport system membrane component KefB/Trk K+ transport system NAD-binding subunit